MNCSAYDRIIVLVTVTSDGFYTERAERSLQPPSKNVAKQPPLKNAAKYLPTVVLNQGGFKGSVDAGSFQIKIERSKSCTKMSKTKKKKGQRPTT